MIQIIIAHFVVLLPDTLIQQSSFVKFALKLVRKQRLVQTDRIEKDLGSMSLENALKLRSNKLILMGRHRHFLKSKPTSTAIAAHRFGRIKKLGFIVLSIPFGSVENERLWKVMTSVESKKRGRLKVVQSADQVFVRSV
jgi:hypothetical protein